MTPNVTPEVCGCGGTSVDDHERSDLKPTAFAARSICFNIFLTGTGLIPQRSTSRDPSARMKWARRARTNSSPAIDWSGSGEVLGPS